MSNRNVTIPLDEYEELRKFKRDVVSTKSPTIIIEHKNGFFSIKDAEYKILSIEDFEDHNYKELQKVNKMNIFQWIRYRYF